MELTKSVSATKAAKPLDREKYVAKFLENLPAMPGGRRKDEVIGDIVLIVIGAIMVATFGIGLGFYGAYVDEGNLAVLICIFVLTMPALIIFALTAGWIKKGFPYEERILKDVAPWEYNEKEKKNIKSMKRSKKM